jgi:hypothetical protein
MKRVLAGLLVFLLGAAAVAQRPSDPALLVPESAPVLDYVVAPAAVSLPEGLTMGATASVAFDPSGHLWVLTRGDKTFFEFDADGKFIRAFGDRLFTEKRTRFPTDKHGLLGPHTPHPSVEARP